MSSFVCTSPCSRHSSVTSTRLGQRSSPFSGRFSGHNSLHRGSVRGALQVTAGKGKGKQLYRQRPGMPNRPQMPPTPPVDPENEEFVLFVRSKKLPQWYPLSVVKGGTAANMLVKSMSGNFAKDTFKKTLIRNIGQVVYKEREEIETSLREKYPPMKAVKQFEYGFKIRDKSNPNSWYIPENILVIPPEDELPEAPLDEMASKAKNLFGGFGKKDSA
uniref:Metalloendopeptidase family-saccharolysin & thimet oligopeptidase n=1 Tax=Tetraselmis sp. GSL018 TaxID=582737 RepID=A0A061S8D6_9CHLO|mmetsp:Transcript_9166/g.22096  ORF Transcript_9166/g.22096 Transcript_9166/m.22096 type:complete len:217 (-) Transcript_9166:179-829(-)